MIHLLKKRAFKEFSRKERISPDIYRAILVAVALTVPLIVAHFFKMPLAGTIPAITAQLISSARIQGTYGEKALILILASLALATTAFIGTLAGTHTWTAVLFLGLVAGIASLARGIGDYGQVFGLSGVILFLISLYPPHTFENAVIHAILVLAGAAWAMILSLYRWPFKPHEPLYLDISKPWYISSTLMKAITEPSFDIKKSASYIGQSESELRKAINNVLPWLRKNKNGTSEFRRDTLKTVRAASRFGATALTLHNELQSLSSDKIPLAIYLKIKKTADVLGEAGNAITDAIISQDKDALQRAQSITRKGSVALNNLIKAVETGNPETEVWIGLLHIISLFESAISYLEDAAEMLGRMKKSSKAKYVEGSVHLTYRFKRIWKLSLLQLQPNSLLLKHSIRVMIMTSIGLSIHYLFDIPRGYWIVLTVMVLLQPDFAATWEKARDRMLGTILGIIGGSALLVTTLSFHFSFLIVAIAICSFLFAYYSAKNYKIAVIFITIMLVAMLDITKQVDWHIALDRLLATVIGGILAIVGAYFIWPNKESLQFPFRLSKAISSNRNYLLQIGYELHFKTGFHQRVMADRRKAEVEIINLDDSIKKLRAESFKSDKKLILIHNLTELNRKLTREPTSFASFLREIRGITEFQEAEELIKYCSFVLLDLSRHTQSKQLIEIPAELNFYLEEIENKTQIIKGINALGADTGIIELETSLLPYEIVFHELKKITSIIKDMVSVTNEWKSL